MISALPTGARGRWLALGITMLAAALIWSAVIGPLVAWQASLITAGENRGAIARRMAALVETLPELRRQAGAPESQGRGGGLGGQPDLAALLDGRTDALAGAALQVRLRELASQTGVSLASAETLPAEAVGGFRRISVRIAATGAWPVLVRLLEALDQASPRMLVDDVQLQSALSLGTETTRPLTVTLTVLAFRPADVGTNPPAAAP